MSENLGSLYEVFSQFACDITSMRRNSKREKIGAGESDTVHGCEREPDREKDTAIDRGQGNQTMRGANGREWGERNSPTICRCVNASILACACNCACLELNTL